MLNKESTSRDKPHPNKIIPQPEELVFIETKGFTRNQTRT